MTVQGIAAQSVFLEKVPNTFLRVAPFSPVCFASNPFPTKLRAVMPIGLCVCTGLRIPQNWDAFFLHLAPSGKGEGHEAEKHKKQK